MFGHLSPRRLQKSPFLCSTFSERKNRTGAVSEPNVWCPGTAAQGFWLLWVACMQSGPLLLAVSLPELRALFPPPTHPACSISGVLHSLVPGSPNGKAQMYFSLLFFQSLRQAVAGSLHICSCSDAAQLSCRSCLKGPCIHSDILQDWLWSPLPYSTFLERSDAAVAVLCFSYKRS